jgi:hypothetical protein
MAQNFRLAVLVGILATTAACGSEQSSGAPCPEPSGEFPPTHCAYVLGRLTSAGTPIVGAGLRVDEFVPPVGYAYTSNAAATDPLGRFSLLVFRLNEFEPPAVPDTATVYVKLYATTADARPGAATDDSLAVLMTFAPMGMPVDTTEVELTLP